MTVDKECKHCGSRYGHHSEITDAACAYRAASTADIREYAPADHEIAALDLLAHLRGVFPEEQANRATRYVLDLGWRPVVGSGAKP